jgi:uncharacterized protein (DUF2235 family)
MGGQPGPDRRKLHRIILLSDGTGNSSAQVWRTNVWRLFEFLDLTGPDQVARYDDGVGSSSFLPWALVAGAFGLGLKRNVLDLYEFVSRNYRQGDGDKPDSQIYAFGFSRGAFTIRVLIGLILSQGLLPYDRDSLTEEQLHVGARSAYRAFRADRYHSILRVESLFRCLRDAAIATLDRLTGRSPYDRSRNLVVRSIEFVGIWDTVAAYGLPIDEMTRGYSKWIWPLELPNRVLDKRVSRACHALALDDERTTFHPVLWTESGEQRATVDEQGKRWLKDERISQVWFVGTHSNVGGGYPDDALAYIPLYWIMEEARDRGLLFKASPLDPEAFRRAASARDKDGREYDSRAGLAGYYRYGPRKLADLCNMRISNQSGDSVEITVPKIHETVFLRIRSDSSAYAPIGLPSDYAVVMADREIVQGTGNPFEAAAEAQARAQNQEAAWNIVWLRRIVYFATLAASFHLAAFWLFHAEKKAREFESPIPLVSQFIRLIESFLPRQVAHWWTDCYATNPNSFAIGVIVLIVLMAIGSKLRSQITDSMRIIWRSRSVRGTLRCSPVHYGMFRLRTSVLYQTILQGARKHVLPFFSAILLVWLGAVTLNRLAFNVVDPLGVFCASTAEDKLETLSAQKPRTTRKILFRTKSICFPTGVKVTRGAKYIVTFTEKEPWQGPINTHPDGFKTTAVPFWKRLAMYAGEVPLRRLYFRRWFTVVARIGPVGQYEDFLDPTASASSRHVYFGETGTIRRDGELFLYVNHAVVTLPWLYRVFYSHNEGTAEVEVMRVGH